RATSRRATTWRASYYKASAPSEKIMRCRCTKLSPCFAWLQALADRDVRLQIESGSKLEKSPLNQSDSTGILGRPNQPHALEVRQFQPLTCAVPTSTGFAQIVSLRYRPSSFECFRDWSRAVCCVLIAGCEGL